MLGFEYIIAPVLGGAAAALFGGNIVGRFLGMLREPTGLIMGSLNCLIF